MSKQIVKVYLFS